MSAAYRLALADALQLHDERVRNADVALRAARQAADDAEARLHAVMQARDNFKRAIPDAESAQQGGRDTAAQSDEIEALRAERDLFRDETIELVRQNGEWQARAERLAEALRLYMSAGFGNSTDFYKQAEAKRAATEALHPTAAQENDDA